MAQTGQGHWHPENNAHAWIQFCLRAHFQQAQTIIKRHNWFGRVYEDITKIGIERGLNERTFFPLMDGAMGFRVRAGVYREEQELSDVVASRDLRKLCDEGLVIPHGERRGRFYTGAKFLQEIAQATKFSGRGDDPYELVRARKAADDSPRLL